MSSRKKADFGSLHPSGCWGRLLLRGCSLVLLLASRPPLALAYIAVILCGINSALILLWSCGTLFSRRSCLAYPVDPLHHPAK